MILTEQAREAIEFEGSPTERAIAEQVLELLRAHGRFMSSVAPIRVSLSSIADYLDRDGSGPGLNVLRSAVEANPQVFAVEEINSEPVVVTTSNGRVSLTGNPVSAYSFAQRFLTPLPTPERAAQPVRERARIDPSWASLPTIIEGFDADEEAEIASSAEAAAEAAVIQVIAPTPVETEPGETASDLHAMDEALAEDREPAPARTITLPVAPATDVTGVDDVELASVIGDRLRADPRVANFGDQWMMEDRVPRFSRGDLRRLKDYIQEQEQPLTDDMLVQDVLGVRQGSPDFDITRFGVNFRLSREHREFDFVGTSNQRFWSTTNLPQIGTTRRKPNEIGTDYRFLLDETTDASAPRSLTSVDHVLTFYEYHHGLLPFDAAMMALLPSPLLPNQRSAVLTFETPQSYTTYLVELRFPTPNRGGFILGLDDFYTENLVPGAIISINRTENDGHYRVEYLQESNAQERLLELDDRRAQRYLFRPTTYACGVDPRLLLTEERFPRLGSERPLDEKIRRRPESVLAATFERVGEKREGGFWATFDDLFAAASIERPFSERLLRSILDHDDTGAFSRDPDGVDAYTYVPGGTP